MAVYVTVTSVDPLRVYWHSDATVVHASRLYNRSSIGESPEVLLGHIVNNWFQRKHDAHFNASQLVWTADELGALMRGLGHGAAWERLWQDVGARGRRWRDRWWR